MKNIFYLGIAAILLSTACTDQETTEKVVGLKPVYGTIDDISTSIKTGPSKSLKQVGKIYVYGDKLLINEVNKGVHIYDNSDPSNPQAINFISIPGNVDVAIKDNYMYADMGVGLITIDINDLNDVKVTSFEQEHINIENTKRPPSAVTSLIVSNKVYFECPDASKGLILSWEVEEMPKPECYINQ